ncbi:hypothetical protein KFE96_05130 [Kordiimonas sp. SCSIO 12603]|uniref:hypothetical protein n=1 Tax=Kordiimonas sp. SCSIO 12603 TaxID=2829596 RepID=UPI002102E1A1|nr:hypothetical protein [Kordiimonas sp. SCSIO 12603]UTW59689.1 hypothetical protein KFE96_05130 [Kordiimonas sp. SCSIO 12603]
MTEHTSSQELEAARARLETALSGLAQGVITTREALNSAASITNEKVQLAERVAKLETENLKLHEQIAAHALQTPSSEIEDQLATLREEKSALEQNYRLLKTKYADLQEQVDKPKPLEVDVSGQLEMRLLQQRLEEMQAEKEMIKAELDRAIASLEPLAGDA